MFLARKKFFLLSYFSSAPFTYICVSPIESDANSDCPPPPAPLLSLLFYLSVVSLLCCCCAAAAADGRDCLVFINMTGETAQLLPVCVCWCLRACMCVRVSVCMRAHQKAAAGPIWTHSHRRYCCIDFYLMALFQQSMSCNLKNIHTSSSSPRCRHICVLLLSYMTALFTSLQQCNFPALLKWPQHPSCSSIKNTLSFDS